MASVQDSRLYCFRRQMELAERLGDVLVALVCGSRGAEGLVLDLLGSTLWHGVGAEGVGWCGGLLEGVGVDEEGGTYVWNSMDLMLHDWLLRHN